MAPEPPSWRLALRSIFVRNVASAFLAQMAALLIGMANAALTARWLGLEGKGILTLTLLVPATLALFLNGGLPAANVWFVGSRRLTVAAATQNAVLFTLLASLGGALIAALGLLTGTLPRLTPGAPAALIALALLSLPSDLLGSCLSAVLQGAQRLRTVNLITFLQSGALLMLTALLVIGFGWGLWGATLASAGASLLALSLFARQVRQEGGLLRPRLDPPLLRQTLTFGMRGYVGNLLQFFNYRLDVFIVGAMLGPTAVGLYGAAVMLAELLWRLPHAVSFVIFPTAAALRPADMNRLTPRIVLATLAIAALGGAGLVLFGQPLLRLVYGAAFVPAYPALLALLPGVVLLGGGKVLTNEIAGRGFLHYNSINAGLALALTVLGDLWLIPRLGILGAALASSIAYSAIFLTAVAFYRSVSRRSVQPPAPPA